MPSATLRPEEKSTIRQAIGHDCQIYTATIARLYEALPSDRRSWTLSHTGAIAFMKDTRRKDAFFLRMVDLRLGAVVWEQELYRGFQYVQLRPFFHSFTADDWVCGLSFADEHEALSFYTKVINRENLRLTRQAPATPAQKTTIGATDSVKFTKKDKKDKRPKLDKSAIGAPTNFRHLTHIGWDPTKGFSTMNIPPEWKKVFEQAGVTEEQLQDQQTAQFIFDFMSQQQPISTSAQNNPNIASSEPPSLPRRVSTGQSTSRRAPPPPPPSRPGNRKPAPPPPPSRDPPASKPPPPPAPSRPTFGRQSSLEAIDTQESSFKNVTTTSKSSDGRKQTSSSGKPSFSASGLNVDFKNMNLLDGRNAPDHNEVETTSDEPSSELLLSPRKSVTGIGVTSPPPLPVRSPVEAIPPAPPGGLPPPPPPPPSQLDVPPAPRLPSTTRGASDDLMSAIRSGSQLRPVSSSPLPEKSRDNRSDLLKAIRDGAQLRPVSQSPPTSSAPAPSNAGGGDLANALKMALAGRQAAMVGDHDSDESGGADDDDEDW